MLSGYCYPNIVDYPKLQRILRLIELRKTSENQVRTVFEEFPIPALTAALLGQPTNLGLFQVRVLTSGISAGEFSMKALLPSEKYKD